MFELLLISKILVSIVAVVALSLVAENVSPKVAGILSGYPLGTAIALFFIGIENGQAFAAQSAVYAIAGFSASLVLVYCYYQAALRVSQSAILLPGTLAVLGFLLAAGLLSQVSAGLVGGLLVSVGAIVFFALRFRVIENALVADKVKLTHWVLIIRAIAAAAMVLAITGVAKVVGANLAGSLAAFPVTLFPFLLIIHKTYGRAQALTIIKNYPYGLGALIVYTLSVSFTYPSYGVALGTGISFFFATLYLVLFSYVMNKRAKRPSLLNEKNRQA